MEKINDGEVAHDENVSTDIPLRKSMDSATREAIGGASTDDLPPNYYKSVRYIGSFLSFTLSFQGAFMGYVMIANALAIIDADLGPSKDIIWILLVFVLCQTITFTVVGRMSDLFGRRWFFIGGNLLALVGYLICSRAHSINMLIGGSVISGLGTGVQSFMPAISGELVPNRHRYLALGITFLLMAPLSTISPGLARVFCVQTKPGWRWVYYFVALISGLAGLLQILFYFPPEFKHLHSKNSKRDILKGLDYFGLVIFIGSFTSLLLGISWGGQQYPWQSYRVVTTIVVGGVGLIAFVFYEIYAGVRHPLVPMHLFRNRNYVALLIVNSVGSMIFFALNIVYPTQLSALFGATPNAIGWLSCTLTAGSVAGQFFAGFATFLPKFKIKWQLVIACCIFTAFTGGSAAVTSSTKTMAIVFSLISGLMIGYMEVLTIGGGPMTLEPKDIGLAAGVQYTIRSACSALADSIFVTILDNKLSTNLPKYIVPAALQDGLPQTSLVDLLTAVATGNTTAIQLVPGITPAILVGVHAATITAYEKSFQVIYFACIAFGGCAIISSLMVVSGRQQEVITSQIARKLQGVRGEETLNNKTEIA